MLLLLLLIPVMFSSIEQQARMQTDPARAGAERTVDSKLHEDVLTLIVEDGTKMRLQGGIKQQVENGKREMMQGCSRCMPEFGEEWAKRMLNRVQVEDFVQIYVRSYEKFLDDQDVKQLIALAKAKKESKSASLSPELKQKLISAMPSMQSEILGGCVQMGAKLGAEVGQAIENEHPEYLKPIAAPNKK